MAKHTSYDFDDFPLSPCGSGNAVELYESFLQSEELVKGLSKKEVGDDRNRASYNMWQELHAARTTNSALFRAREDADQALKLLWLSRVRETAQIFITLNEIPDFQGLTPADLSEISTLSLKASNLERLSKILFERGILLIYELAIPGMKLDGAVFTLNAKRPVIALSLRYPRLDIFWFTLMHELAHLVLHYEKLADPILDDVDADHADIVERMADRLASNSLISRSDWRSCSALYSPSEKAVREFAFKVRVHPSIVAGRLRRELGRHDIFSDIVNEINVRKVLLGYD